MLGRKCRIRTCHPPRSNRGPSHEHFCLDDVLSRWVLPEGPPASASSISAASAPGAGSGGVSSPGNRQMPNAQLASSSCRWLTVTADRALYAWKSTRGICIAVLAPRDQGASGCGFPVIGTPPDTTFNQPKPEHLIGRMFGRVGRSHMVDIEEDDSTVVSPARTHGPRRKTELRTPRPSKPRERTTSSAGCRWRRSGRVPITRANGFSPAQLDDSRNSLLEDNPS
jgi:hypothetical protein